MKKSDYNNSFELYIDTEYEYIYSDFYRCNGGHVWHYENIRDEWNNMPS